MVEAKGTVPEDEGNGYGTETPAGFQIQRDGTTVEDRYPEIFKTVGRLCAGKTDVRVLSFGCSTGEEPYTLSTRYLPQAQIVGLDASVTSVEAAKRARSLGESIVYDISTEETLARYGPYDVIFAMSVLCRWPDLADIVDASNVFPFKRYLEMVRLLDEQLVPGGLLVIFNSNYSFLDSALISSYEIILIPQLLDNGYVKHFDRNSRAIENYCGTDAVYRKLTDTAPPVRGRTLRFADEDGRRLGTVCTNTDVLDGAELRRLFGGAPGATFSTRQSRAGVTRKGRQLRQKSKPRGHVDLWGPDGVTGWVWDAARPVERLMVSIEINGSVRATVVASGYRADLEAAGVGDGRYAFSVAMPGAGAKEGDILRCVVREVGYEIPLG